MVKKKKKKKERRKRGVGGLFNDHIAPQPETLYTDKQ